MSTTCTIAPLGKVVRLSLLWAIGSRWSLEPFRALQRFEEPTATEGGPEKRRRHGAGSKLGEEDEDSLDILDVIGLAMPLQAIPINPEAFFAESEQHMADQISLSSSRGTKSAVRTLSSPAHLRSPFLHPSYFGAHHTNPHFVQCRHTSFPTISPAHISPIVLLFCFFFLFPLHPPSTYRIFIHKLLSSDVHSLQKPAIFVLRALHLPLYTLITCFSKPT